LSGPEPISLRDLGKLILELEGAPRPFLHLPVSFCRGLAALLARVMRDPPITPYAVAGFTHDADLDCAQAAADFGYAPRGVRAGLAACIPARGAVASSPTPTEIRRAT
jgi:nucleoside-diphosphate-sugar epimerase